jgi:hypothetical protein
MRLDISFATTFLKQDHLVMALSGEHAGFAITLESGQRLAAPSRCALSCTAPSCRYDDSVY